MPPFDPERDESAGRRGTLVPLGFIALGFLLTVLPTSAQQQVASAVRASALAPFIWVQSSIRDARLLGESLDDLRAQLDSAQAVLHAQRTLVEENETLRDLLRLESRGGPAFRPASAVRSRTLGSESMFLLDVGSLDGVEVNDPIVVGDGLVGVVTRVGPRTSVAIDWTHPDFRASAMTEDGRALGFVAAESGSFREEDRLVLSGVEFHTPLDSGEVIVTSGRGSAYPRGIPLGRVRELADVQEGVARSYRLDPAVRAGAATHVLVLQSRVLGEGGEPIDALWGRDAVPPDSAGTAADEGDRGTGDAPVREATVPSTDGEATRADESDPPPDGAPEAEPGVNAAPDTVETPEADTAVDAASDAPL